MPLVKKLAPVLLAFSLIGGMTASVAAQDEPSATPAADTGVPEGLETWYVRSVSADLMTVLDPEVPEEERAGWLALTMNVLEFENEDAAGAFVGELAEQVDASDQEGVEVEQATLDLEFDHTATDVAFEEPGIGSFRVVEVIAQDGAYVYAVGGQSLGDTETTTLVESTIQAMYDAEAGDGEAAYDATGASSGGNWDVMPTTEEISESEEALVTGEDVIVFPVDDGISATPAA